MAGNPRAEPGGGVLSAPFLAACAAEAAILGMLLARPLFWAFHFEFALAANLSLVALAGPFAIASWWPGAGLFDPSGARGAFLRTVILAVIPFVAALLSQVLVGSCDLEEGVRWYFLLPGAGALLINALALACSVAASRRKTALLLYSAAVAFFVMSFGWHLYFGIPYRLFNLLLGYWPGVLYDEFVPIEIPLVFARAETVLLAAALSSGGLFALRGRKSLAVVSALAGVLFLGAWTAESGFGVHPTRTEIERALGLQLRGRYADWIAPRKPETLRKEISLLAARFDYQAERLGHALSIDPMPRMKVVVFATSDQKRKIVGAESTIVTRPWLGELYLDMEGRAGGVLRHEAVHLVTAPWAYPGVGISPNIALLEGLAVSLGGSPGTIASPEGLAAAVLGERPDFDLAAFLSGPGFWRLSPELAYPLAGAFITWLRGQDLGEPFPEIYRRGWTSHRPIADWAGQWRAELGEVVPTEAEEALARRALAARPLYAKRCAHEVAQCLHADEGTRLWAGSETTGRAIARALALDPAREDVILLSARTAFLDGNTAPLEKLLPSAPSSDVPPSQAELQAASLWAWNLLGRGDHAKAAQWFGFAQRWTSDLRGLGRAAQAKSLAEAKGLPVTFGAGGGGWTITCSLAMGVANCDEGGEGAKSLSFPSPLEELAAAFSRYEVALATFEFDGAVLWAERMEKVAGVAPFLVEQAAEARDEALWLKENFESYLAKVAGEASPQ